MSHSSTHAHAEFDLFTALVGEYGESFASVVAEAEAPDFAWDSRFAERDLGAWEPMDDDDDGVEIVRVAGYFWGRYFVATFVVDARRRVTAMVSKRGFDRFADAERAFLDGGG